MAPSCCIPNCKNTVKKGFKLFRIPTGIANQSKREKWLSMLDGPVFFKKDLRVCCKHFCKNDFDVGMRYSTKKDLRLKPDAFPHLHLDIKDDVPCNYDIEYEMPGCAVYGCKNSTTKGFSMKAFPRDPERRKLWASKVGRGDWQPTDRSTICEAHFEEHMWEKVQVDGKKKLKCTAVPTIFNFSTPTTRRNKQSNKPVITIASSCKKKSFLEKSPTYVDLNEPSTSSTLTRAKTSAQSDNIKSSFVKAAKKDIRRKAKPSLQIYRRRFNTLFKKYKLCKNFLENSKKKIINLEKEVQTLKKSNLELENTLLLRSLLTDEQISAIKKNTQVVVVSLPHLKMKPVCIKFPK